jgi:hypothetical protein
MKVVVVVAGVYNGPEHRALPWAEAGAVVEVADGWYGDTLIERGCVRSCDSGLRPSAQDDMVGPGPSEAQVAVGPGEMPGRPRKAKAKGEVKAEVEG